MTKRNNKSLIAKTVDCPEKTGSSDDLQSYIANAKWFEDHYEQIRVGHEGKVVGINNGKIVWVSCGDIKDIKEKIKKTTSKNQLFIGYIHSSEDEEDTFVPLSYV